jgi:hypothetical protein
MARWTDTATYPPHVPADEDILPIADVAQAVTERQRTVTVGQLRGAVANQAHVASVDPAASDDNTEGHVVGSLWYNDATEVLYVATSVATGAAVWEPTLGLGTVTVRTVTTNDTPTDADTGTRLNVTSAATISLNHGLAVGAWFVVRAETGDPVDIDTTGTASMSPAGPLVLTPFTAALCTHVGSDAWQVEGSFEAGS